MPAATTFSYHISGPVVPQCNLGSLKAYVNLGVCRDGANISITPLAHPIKHDGAGGPEGAPAEYIGLNAIARVRFQLSLFAGTYVNTLRAMAIASATDGVLPLPGTPFGANGLLPGLYLPYGGAAEVDGPWWFPTCRVVVPGNNQVSDKESLPEFEFESFVYLDGPTHYVVTGQPLYTRTAPV